MKTKSTNLLTISMVLILSLLISWSSGTAHFTESQTQNSILYVKPQANGNCASWATACDLQTALTSAQTGDQIWAATGTYHPTEVNDRTATFQLKSGVAIYGGFAGDETSLSERDLVNNITVLSGNIGSEPVNTDNSYHVVTGSGVDASAILDSLTISDGNADGYALDFYNLGGGMYNVSGSPTLTNIIFSNNIAQFGGGMYNIENSNPSLTDVTFSNNYAYISAGGMSNRNNSSPTLTSVTFSGNSAENNGGGMFNFFQSNPILNDVVFSGNTVNAEDGRGGGMFNQQFSSPILTNVIFDSNSSGWIAGGMYSDFHSSPSLTEVTFSNNSAIVAGGMYNADSSNPILTNVNFVGNFINNDWGVGGGMANQANSPTLTNVTFSNNSAPDQGGGMFNYESSPTLTNVTFSGNSVTSLEGEGGGMFNNFGTPTLTNVTFTGNSAIVSGGGIASSSSTPIITNSILWGNTPDQISGLAAVTYSDVQGSWAGTGNISQNPLLGPLADNGGFTQTHALGVGSPAIDAGDPTNCPATDQRGFPRPIDGDGLNGPRCDMGAYEAELKMLDFSIYLPLILR